MLIPKDLEDLDLSLKQCIDIIEIRRAKSRVANRLKCLPERKLRMQEEIEELQEKEDAIMTPAAQPESKE